MVTIANIYKRKNDEHKNDGGKDTQIYCRFRPENFIVIKARVFTIFIVVRMSTRKKGRKTTTNLHGNEVGDYRKQRQLWSRELLCGIV